MATVKELEARVLQLEIRCAELESGMLQLTAGVKQQMETLLAEVRGTSAKPTQTRGAVPGESQTYSSPAEAMAAAKAMAKTHRVCVTGCVVTARPR